MSRQLEGQRLSDGIYAVTVPEPVRDPIDWFAVVWVAVGVVGLLVPFVSIARWLAG